jgi:hypothetical protein
LISRDQSIYVLVSILNLALSLDQLTRSPMVHLTEFRALSAEYRFGFFFGWGLVIRGRSLIASGQAEEGLALLRQGKEALRAIGAVVAMPSLFTSLGVL